MLWLPNALRCDAPPRPNRVLPKLPRLDELVLRKPLLRFVNPLRRDDEMPLRPLSIWRDRCPSPRRDVNPELRRVALFWVVKPEFRLPIERRLMPERFPKFDPRLPKLERGTDRTPLRFELRVEKPEIPWRVDRVEDRPKCELRRLTVERPNSELRWGLEPRLKDEGERPMDWPPRRDEPKPLRFDREIPLERPRDMELLLRRLLNPWLRPIERLP